MKVLVCFLGTLVGLSVLGLGCDYRVALVDEPALEMNAALIGRWEHIDQQNRRNVLLVLPMDATTYLVVLTHEDHASLYGRATKWEQGEQSLVQIDWIGTGEGVVPDEDGARFQYVKYAVEDDALRFRLLSTAVVPDDVSSVDALIVLMEEHRDDPALFRGEAVYRRVDE